MKPAIRIEQDDDPMSPREWDNLGTMVCFHKRYTLGDEGHGLRTDDFDDWDAIAAHLRDECGAVQVLPVYMIDHSGLALATTPFGCSWDSGQVGFIYTTAARIVELCGNAPIDVSAALAAEVAEYSQYVSGEVYAYVVTDEYGEIVESCGGFYGEDDARSEAEAALQGYLEHAPKPCVQQVTTCSPS